MKTLKQVAWELDAMRNELAGGHADLEDLGARCDAVGRWLAVNGKPTGLSRKLLDEAESLRDKIDGGDGMLGYTRIVFV